MAPVHCYALSVRIVTALRRRTRDDAFMPSKQRGPGYCASDRFAPQKLLEVQRLRCQERVLSTGRSGLELWGGVECTINRVGDAYYDQLASSGHRERAREDLDLFADLGLRTLRTAVHWECSEKQSWNPSHRVLETMDRLGPASHCRLAAPRQWAAVNKSVRP
jgi:hypothetical protein